MHACMHERNIEWFRRNDIIFHWILYGKRKNTTSRKFHLIVNVPYTKTESGWRAAGRAVCWYCWIRCRCAWTFTHIYVYGNERKCRWYECNQVNGVNFSTKTYFHGNDNDNSTRTWSTRTHTYTQLARVRLYHTMEYMAYTNAHPQNDIIWN